MSSQGFIITRRIALAAAALALALAPAAGQGPPDAGRPGRAADIPRTPDGRPDLQGMWNAATLTPLERPPQFEGRPAISEAEAIAYSAEFLEANSLDRRDGGAERDRSRAYPDYFTDRGTGLTEIAGAFRTSLIVDPPDGRIPALTPEGERRVAQQNALRTPTADAGEQAGVGGQGIYDDPELRPLAERCLLSFGSSSGPPSLPVLYNNFKQIVQTPDHVMILVEMVHDARVIPIGRPHAPPQIRKWLGDSVGRWEGDTLVVETTNFTDKTRFRGASDRLRVVERFSLLDARTLLYQFTVDDPTTWTRPWTGEYAWQATAEPLYEYACHEGNYAFGAILRGARIEEREAAELALKDGRR